MTTNDTQTKGNRMTLTRDGKEWRIDISLGFVSVYVPVFDGDGRRRTIDFPRVGYVLYGPALFHWTAKPYLIAARRAAKTAIGDYEYTTR
jgi:hypothetical protein